MRKVMVAYGLISIAFVLTVTLFLIGEDVKAESYDEEPFEVVEYPIKETEVIILEKEEPVPLYSAEEIDLMARVVMSEASILSIEGKQAVAQTILNRVASADFPDTISEVIFQPFQYSTADNGEPNEECYKAVQDAIEFPHAFPEDMYFFRTDRYHGYGIPYMKIGNTYFSRGGK